MASRDNVDIARSCEATETSYAQNERIHISSVQGMNDENCPPQDGDVSVSSVKAGAAVFGSLVFRSEHPEHSLCYSPSPFVSRNNEDALRESTDGKVLSFDKRVASLKEPKEKERRKKEEAPTMEKHKGLRQREPKQKPIPHRKNPRAGGLPKKRDGYKRQNTIPYLAGDSVNSTINGVRRSKEESLKRRVISVSELRQQRRQEREGVLAFNIEAGQMRRQVIELRKKLNERFRQSKVDRERKLREERLAKVENEIQFKSQVHVEHTRTLKEQENTRRRMSVDDRAKLRKNHQEGKEQMKLALIEEDQALLEERYESSVAVRKTNSDNAEKRRNSFTFRNGDARRIRKMLAEREAEKMHEEHESYALKWNGEGDADNYKRQIAKERRESLALRNVEGKRIRDLEGHIKVNERQDEHESFELKWAGERDADGHRKHMAKERRDSFAFRNAEGTRIRDLEGQMKANDHDNEHESYELKWAGERDADDYKKQMDAERRDSFAFRNAEGRNIRDLESKLKANDHHTEHESYELKWAGERDADDYKKQMDGERRDSFTFRNAEGKRIRDLETRMKAADHDNEHESYELKWAGERDADDYRKQMDAERRDSFAFRNAEGKSIRDLESQMKATDLHNEHESYELKWAGERDADDYKKQMDGERRDSFAFRNAEGKSIRDLESHMKAADHDNEHESYELKWAGERDADDYKNQMEEKRRESFAFRNAEGKHIRDLESQMKAKDHRNEHESYELKWAGERDADKYKKQLDKERRDSFSFRNVEGKRIRDLESQMKATGHHTEHKSYELKWAGERDADGYKKQLNEERRDSFAFRNAEGNRIRDLERQMMATDHRNEHKSYELKWAGERDADDHRKQMDEERRDSFAFRNAEGRRIRDVEGEMKAADHDNEHESYELKWASERDVDTYKKQMDEERRESLNFRNKEAAGHREVMRELLNLAQEKESESLMLKWEGEQDAYKYQEECAAKERQHLRLKGKEQVSSRMQAEINKEMKSQEDHEDHLLDTRAWQDVNDYVQECNRRKRLSLAFRAKEKRRHFQIEKDQAESKIHQQHLDTLYRSEDARYIEMAKLKERARIALESLRLCEEVGTVAVASLLG